MIISRTPLRISFAGGGSDINTHYQKYGGAVLSTAIDKYIYITVNKKFDSKIRASYSKTEIVDKTSDLQHELIREALKLVRIDGGIEITSISDIPSEGTGLGSSSSYTVGLLHALYAYKGQFVSAEKLASEACRIEIGILKKPIGKQDQYVAAYGGLNFIRFNRDGVTRVDPVICNLRTKHLLLNRLLLFYTGITRSANSILNEQKKNMDRQKHISNYMQQMVMLAKKMYATMSLNKLDHFGEFLHTSWLLKSKMANSITNEKINKWYAIARKKGAIGGKILGAGGGGFLLLYSPKKKHTKIIQSLPELKPIHFNLEPQGSKIIFVGS